MSDQRPPMLRRGEQGASVERLQRDFSERGYDLGPSGVNGIFDEHTENAVIKFQTDNNLTADGVVGPQTGQKLGASVA